LDWLPLTRGRNGDAERGDVAAVDGGEVGVRVVPHRHILSNIRSTVNSKSKKIRTFDESSARRHVRCERMLREMATLLEVLTAETPLVLVLEADPVLERAVVVADMHAARWAHPR
jgi:hypothetical protein